MAGMPQPGLNRMRPGGIPSDCLTTSGERQQRYVARLLDGFRHPALMWSAHPGQAARNELSALGNKLREQPHVLVVDIVDLRPPPSRPPPPGPDGRCPPRGPPLLGRPPGRGPGLGLGLELGSVAELSEAAVLVFSSAITLLHSLRSRSVTCLPLVSTGPAEHSRDRNCWTG